jgi:signal transduction histidine kinase
MTDRESIRSDAVLNIIDHEIGNYLTVISGARVILRFFEELEPENTKQMLDDIARAGEHISQIMREMRALTAGTLEVEPRYITDMIPSIVGEFVHSTHRKVELEPGEQLTKPIVLCASGSVSMVLSNLLRNADKYGVRELPIKVKIDETDEEIKISVTNFGNDIVPKDLERVFDMGYRARSAKESGVAGSGIGLAFCKLAVEAQNGRIWAESEYGITTFSFTLPKVEIPGE